MHEELKTVLTLFRDKRRILDIVKTPEIYIQQSSSADEVEKWLQAKGFSDKVVKKLNGLNGNELFALKRHSLEEYCGSDEGRRLASQITIQRNISGVSCSQTIKHYGENNQTLNLLTVQNRSVIRTSSHSGQGSHQNGRDVNMCGALHNRNQRTTHSKAIIP